MLPAQDGMVVSTTDAEAVAMRRAVIEWLMINHPHDCPVCDEGGECQLQDFTIAGGHGIRRYDGLKRTHVNQYLGPNIEHEMNRCIQCYRCVRFYQEYAGGTDFGVMGRAGMVYFGRQQDGPLESPFSGNLADICPTGVFTDKTARFRARYWDYDMAPSVCPGCSLGCNTVPMARYRELLKVTARRNNAVNGWFICDRGRFSPLTPAVNATNRPRQAMIDGEPVTMEIALNALHERLIGFIDAHGSSALAIIGSSRMSQEAATMAARLREATDAEFLCYSEDRVQFNATVEAVALLNEENTASQQDVRQADLIAIVASDLVSEAPMMALAVRQAWRNGAKVYCLSDEPAASPHLEMYVSEYVPSLAEVPFRDAHAPVLICGANRQGLDHIRTTILERVKLAFILDGPNSFGTTLLAREHGAIALADALASGKVKGIIALEADLTSELPAEICVLGAADWLPTTLIARAEIVLPATAWVEMDGTFVNNEGRSQRFEQVLQPGLPIRGLTPELHPSRIHRHDSPGGDVHPTEKIVSALLTQLGEHVE
jgi:NADH-quinone oxidoreductase subunit G